MCISTNIISKSVKKKKNTMDKMQKTAFGHNLNKN